MDFWENCVYKDKKSSHYFVIIQLDFEYDSCWVLEVNSIGKKVNWPKEYPISFFNEQNRNLEHIKVNPFIKPSQQGATSKVTDKRSKDCYDYIKSIADQRPDVYYPKLRGKMIRKAVKERKRLIEKLKKEKTPKDQLPFHYNKNQTTSNLFKYFLLGQSELALVMNFSNCGGSGKKRKYKDGLIPGKKRKYKQNEQIQMTDAIIESIQKLFPKLVRKTQGNVSKAYELFSEEPVWAKQRKKPSLTQFKYHGLKVYVPDNRTPRGNNPLEGSSRTTYGIGHECQYDSTVDNTHCVSRTFNLRYIGRMTLYLAVDNFSGMPMGILLCPINPSYEALQYLLLNIVTNKGEFLKMLGIPDKTSEDWPCEELPAKFLGDRAPENTCYNIESWARNLEIQIDLTPSKRPDLKAIVERYIKKLLNAIEDKLENHGLVHRDYGKRMAKDSRKEAALTYHQVLKIIVLEILYQIKFIKIQKYPYTEDMINEGIQAYPLELWKWARRKGLAALIPKSRAEVERNVLPWKEVTATEKGFNLLGMDFIPSTNEGKKVRAEILKSNNRKVRISYNVTSLDVYLNYKTKQYALIPRHHFPFGSLLDYIAFKKKSIEEEIANSDEKQSARAATNKEQNAVIKEATKRRRHTQKVSGTKLTRNDARPFRSVEKENFRKEQGRGKLTQTKTQLESKLQLPSLTSKLRSLKSK